ncbi:MAG TPA: uroporphyrinogen-III C-methyltransferase, partial [Eubacteriaceae bacterium]|nr:uroporphyrinogen-III C-methyltransferase [Eubacteriaceae bacterium]
MSGKVFLVGAGPGEYRFITLMGVDKIKQADVLVYDRLIGNELLNYAKDGCEKIYVGKQSSNHVKTQDEINEILYQKAKENKTVVRLKGGDPFVFGRGGEEGIYLYDRGIDFEVIPGITSAIAGPMMAGIPVTHREVASSFHVITGHLKDEDDEIDWDAIARLKGTLVFLMGMSQKEHIQYSLIEKGMSPDTPVAVITSATTPNQKSIRSTLADFVQEAQNHHLSAPGLIVVGDVVNLQPKLDFAGRRPLKGKKVLITRARQQSSVLKEKVRERGGEPFVFPVIRIKDLREEAGLAETISKMDTYTWIVFTSQNGVSLFFEELFQKGRDVRALHGKKIAAIGKTTAKSLKKYGIVCDLVPDSYVAEDLFKELKPHLKPIDRVLLPRAKGARAYLKEEIEKICP